MQQFVVYNSKSNQRRRWQRFWPRSLITFIAIIEILLTSAILGLELWSMITNIKYSFFFIGFMASIFFIVTSISTCTVACCCRRSLGCAMCTLIVHILAIIASSVLLFYDALFLRAPYTCLWPNNLCNEGLLNLNFFGVTIGTSNEVHWVKFTLIKIQIACAAMMIATCVVYVVIYIYTSVKVHARNKVADPHTIIELGRTQQPPPPHWPDPPRELPPSSDF